MAVTILEALQNAKINLVDNRGHGFAEVLGREQLRNAVELLEKGYPLRTMVDPLLEQYGDVHLVPDADYE